MLGVPYARYEGPRSVGPTTKYWAVLGGPCARYAGLRLVGSPSWAVPYFKQDEDGASAPPCLELRQQGAFRILWPVDPGTREFSVWCKHSGVTPVPRVRVAASPDLGISSDIIVEAQNVLAWHKIVVTVAGVATRGVLEVFLEQTTSAPGAWSRWDNVGVK